MRLVRAGKCCRRDDSFQGDSFSAAGEEKIPSPQPSPRTGEGEEWGGRLAGDQPVAPTGGL